MNTPKLPPLPEPIAFRTRPDATVKWWYGDSETKAPLCEIRERLFSAAQMNDHYLNGYTDALAAIAEHGVPDGWQLVATQRLVNARNLVDRGFWVEGAKVLDELIASAPPAPQVDRSGCTAGTDEECKHRHCATHCPKQAQQAKPPAPQAAVVQQEPVMIYHGDCVIDCGEHGHHHVELLKMIPAGSRLYTHPAQQANGYGPKLMPQVSGFEQAAVVQQEPVISTEHGPWIPSNIHPGETYCKRCLIRSVFAGDRQCDPHVAVSAQQAKPQPLSEEQDRALCEAYCNTASDEYFSARPHLDSAENRRIFYAGHRKAWIEWRAAHGIKE